MGVSIVYTPQSKVWSRGTDIHFTANGKDVHKDWSDAKIVWPSGATKTIKYQDIVAQGNIEILGPALSIIILHGLGYAPDPRRITVGWTDLGPMGISNRWTVTNITATSFTLNVLGTPAALWWTIYTPYFIGYSVSGVDYVEFTYPDTGGVDGWANVTLHISYEEQDEAGIWWGSTDSVTVKFWLGDTPAPQVTFGQTAVGWGGIVSAIVEYLPPSTETSITFEAAAKFIGVAYVESDVDWRAKPSLRVLNRWPELVDWVGAGVVKVFPYGYNQAQQSVTVKKAFSAYEPLTLIEDYRGYTIYRLSGGAAGLYAAKDPYGNAVAPYNTSLTGIRLTVDNDLGATYLLTVTCNLDVTVIVNGAPMQTNASVTLLNGCYVITAPELVMVNGAPYIISYMTPSTGVQFPGPSVSQCLETGPATVHIEYAGAEADMNLEVYRGIQISYDYRAAQPEPYDKCLYAKVGGHGRWFPITQYTVEDVRTWIDSELDAPKNTSITIQADRTTVNEGEQVTFTSVLRRTDTGETIPDMPVVFQVNGQDSKAATTDAGGVCQATILFSAAGVYTVAAVFEGAETLSASAAETQVRAGGAEAGGLVVPILVAAGAALLLTRKG